MKDKVEEVEVVGAEEVVVKKQKVSVTYTLKAFRKNIEKLNEMGLIDKEEVKMLDKIREKIIRKWTENEF